MKKCLLLLFNIFIISNHVLAGDLEDILHHIEKNDIVQNDNLEERTDDETVGFINGEHVEQLLGLELDQEAVSVNTAHSADPNNALREESDSTPGRNSILLKGHQISDDLVENKSLNPVDILCQFYQRIELKFSQDLIIKIINQLENALINEETPLQQKKQIYCTLSQYYEENNLIDQIVEFLLLNMPEGENYCS